MRHAAAEVWMQMLAMVSMPVQMNHPAGMNVHVCVGAVAKGVPDAPEKIQQSKADKRPSGKLATERLNEMQALGSDPEHDPHSRKKYRRDHVSQAAQKRDDDRARARPLFGSGQCRERHIVVRSEQRVHHAEPRCSESDSCDRTGQNRLLRTFDEAR